MSGNTNIESLNGVNTKTLNGEITNGQITNGKITGGGKSEGFKLFANPYVAAILQDSCALRVIFKEFRLQAIAIPL